jgi:predicted short-subunit dehydrogenase-like oxidoreductase (DUF2520 family)
VKKLPRKITIVGAGKVGSTLALLFKDNGFEIVSVISRTEKSAKKLSRIAKCKTISTSVKDVSPQTEFLLLAVPDRVLKNVADEIATTLKINFKKLLVAHVSGIHSVEVLSSLKKKGAKIAGIHPIQTFPKNISIQQLKKNISNNIVFGIECEKKLQPTMKKLARTLGGSSIVIPAKTGIKPLYHLACVIASNFPIVLLKMLEEISSHFHFSKDWKKTFSPILFSSISNALTTSPVSALTGPFVRSDVKTIESHLNALKKYSPQLISIYKELGKLATSSSIESGSISRAEKNGILSILK